MVNVTERAKQEIRNALTANGVDDPGIGLRITCLASGDYTLSPDSEKQGDQVVQYEGSTVILLDEEVSQALEGKTIDSDETAEGPRLVIREG